MEYLVGNKRVRYNPYNMKKDLQIGEGNEGKIYKVKNKAIKFYKPYCKKTRLTKEDSIFLSTIDTKRILTPDDILLSKRREIKGYSTEYIKDLGIENLLNLVVELLKEELNILKEDVTLLSKNLVLLEDIILENIVFNNGIYVIDPGSFSRLKRSDSLIAYVQNIEIINEFLIMELISTATYHLTNERKISRKVTQSIFHDYKEKEYPDLIEYLIDDIKEENLKEYIKTKTIK